MGRTGSLARWVVLVVVEPGTQPLYGLVKLKVVQKLLFFHMYTILGSTMNLTLLCTIQTSCSQHLMSFLVNFPNSITFP